MKVLNFFKRHLFFTIALIIVLIIAIVGFVIAKKLFFSNGGNKFGNRLDGIEEHKITDSTLDEIISSLKSMEQVNDASYNVIGKRADFIIEVKAEVSRENAVATGYKVLELLADDQKSFYDIQVLIKSADAENQSFPMVGYKHKSRNDFSWT